MQISAKLRVELLLRGVWSTDVGVRSGQITDSSSPSAPVRPHRGALVTLFDCERA